MAQEYGQVFSLAKQGAPVEGCTSSRVLLPGIVRFSLATGTDISAESCPRWRLLMVLSGKVCASYGDRRLEAGPLMALSLPADIPVGIASEDDSVYLEITMEAAMNLAVKPGSVFKLADMVPYRDGEVVNRDVIKADTMKLAVMSFTSGTGLDEHSAPGEAIVFALEGTGTIGYEGAEHKISAGENFRFAKGGRHYVKADGPFKMALLLVLG